MLVNLKEHIKKGAKRGEKNDFLERGEGNYFKTKYTPLVPIIWVRATYLSINVCFVLLSELLE